MHALTRIGRRQSAAEHPSNDRWTAIAAQLIGASSPVPALHVANTPMTDAMTALPPQDRLDIGRHFDWLLAAGSSGLALVELSLLRPGTSTLRQTVPWPDLSVQVTEHGALERTRVIVVTDRHDEWAAFGARVSSRRQARIDAFVALLEHRAGGSIPLT